METHTFALTIRIQHIAMCKDVRVLMRVGNNSILRIVRDPRVCDIFTQNDSNNALLEFIYSLIHINRKNSFQAPKKLRQNKIQIEENNHRKKLMCVQIIHYRLQLRR